MDIAGEDRWKRLMALLEPIHTQAVATARRLCRSAADGDDLYQEAMLRAFEKLHTVRDPARFRAWFYAILLSKHRGRMRSPLWKRFRPWESALAIDIVPAGEDGTEWDELRSQAARATRALETLPPEQREAVVLFEIDGYTIEEIADVQRASVPAVKSRLARGRDRLRRWYEARGFGPTPSMGEKGPEREGESARRASGNIVPRPGEELCDE